jgi:hypothetical protein
MNPSFFDDAVKMVQKHGYLEAVRLCTQWRDMSSPGTTSYALHNAVLRELDKMPTVGRLDPE